MPDARWRLLEELFAQTVDLPPDEREAFLARACGDDDELRAEVASLLDSAPRAAAAVRGVIAEAAVAAAPGTTAAPPPALIGARLGPYRVTELIGEGGMGTVFRAVRDDTEFHRVVAIKVLRRGSASPAEVARLRDERQILASLDHPGIVRLFDGGTTDGGIPFLVMEHVEGVPLTAHTRALPVGARVALFRQVCAAVQHAHQHLVVHRDLKPSNILVDKDGVPKLLDFGIAKLLDPGGREAQTRTGMALLTLEYASPEQARGEQVSVATDVYALGAVLYEILTGRPPQRAGDDMLATLRAICEVDPPRPSVVASAADRREVAGDLDNIVMRALQKAPAARYPSVAALADDLARYLSGQPVAARAPTFGYRAGKFARRHRGALALALLAASALATATVVSLRQARRATAQSRIAEQRTRTLLVVQALRELGTGRASRALPYLAEVLRQGEDTPSIRFLLAEASRPLALQLGEPFVLRAGIQGTTWSPDGKTVAVSSWRGDLVLLDHALRPRARLDVSDELIAFPTFTPDGARLVATGHRGDVMVFDVASGRALHRWDALRAKVLARPPRAEIAHLHVDGRHVAAVNHDGEVAVWDLADGRERFALDPSAGRPRATAAVVTADGTTVFVGRDDGSIVRWDVATHTAVAELTAGEDDVLHLRLASDDRLLGATLDGAAHVWNHRTGASRATLGDSPKPVIFALDAAEQMVATYGWDGTVRVFDAHTGQARATLLHPNGLYVRAVAFSPDSARLVTTGGDHAFRIWNTATGELEVLLESFAAAGDTPHSVGGAIDARFSPDGRVLLTASGTELRRWRVTREPLVAELDAGMALYSAKWSPDERYIAAVGRGAAIFDAATGARVRSLDVPTTRLLDVEWSRDGQHLVICGDERTALVFAADGRRIGSLDGHEAHVNGAVFSPDGRQLVTAGDDGHARIWDARTWTTVRTLAHPHRVLSATWSRDGALVVTAGWDRTLRIWNAATGALVRAIPGGTTQYLYASLSPDGRVVASAGHDGEVSLWSARTGARLRSLEGHTGPVTMIEWSPDGEMLVTSGDEETTRLWDPATGHQLAIRRQPHSIMQVWWSADGTRILTVSHAGTVRTWAVERERRPTAEVLELAATHSPWRLVEGRLVRGR